MNETERKWLQPYKELAPEKVFSEFLFFLADAWENKKGLFTDEDTEISITKTLCAHIAPKTRHPSTFTSWGIHYEPQILEELRSGLGHVIGRCDVIISVASQMYVCECKRIYYKNNSMADSTRLYVQEGMWRFLQPADKQQTVAPQYSTWLGFAGMIGYVMHGTISCACNELIVAIKKHASPLSIYSLHPKECPSGEAEHFLSEHVNCLRQPVKMHHIVLGLQDTEETQSEI